jgi:hypothetical protein
LAVDLKNELPEQKGFSERNIKRMLRFYHEYPDLSETTNESVPPPVAKLAVPQNPENRILPVPLGKLSIPSNIFFGLPWLTNDIEPHFTCTSSGAPVG